MVYGNKGGRPRKPNAVKELLGTMKPHRRNEDEPVVMAADLTCPSGLVGEAKAKWEELAPLLDQSGMLVQTDRDTLKAYCLLWVKFLKLERESRTNYKLISRCLAVFVQCKGIMQELGLTPAGRSRIKAIPKTDTRTNLQKFLDLPR